MEEVIKEEKSNSEQLDKLKKVQSNARSLMEQVIEGYPETTKKKIRAIVKLSGINEKDPLFLILLICRITSILLEDAPEHIAQVLERGRVEIIKTFSNERKKLNKDIERNLELHQQTAVDVSVARFSRIIEGEFKQRGLNSKQKIPPWVIGVVLSSMVCVTSLTIGFSAGWSYERSVLGKEAAIRMNGEDSVLLDWAKSEGGKLARNIVAWNEDLEDKICKSKVEDLNVTIVMGNSKATSGYCFLWVDPPNQRKFEKLDT